MLNSAMWQDIEPNSTKRSFLLLFTLATNIQRTRSWIAQFIHNSHKENQISRNNPNQGNECLYTENYKQLKEEINDSSVWKSILMYW